MIGCNHKGDTGDNAERMALSAERKKEDLGVRSQNPVGKEHRVEARFRICPSDFHSWVRFPVSKFAIFQLHALLSSSDCQLLVS